MLRARYVILSFLCLFAFATQAQANYAFTHSDHLGSASWITDAHGDPVQYIHYAPYGELLASQHAYGSSYDERYKFTGKERDAESGYDYFGARYQIVPLGIWGIISRPFVGQNHGDRTNDTLNQTKYPPP